MGIFSVIYSRDKRDTFTLANKEYPRVSWWRDPGLRKLYALLFIPLMTSMVNGYDGSMVRICVSVSDPRSQVTDECPADKLAVAGLFQP